MDDFEKALENYDYEFQRGQIVTGRPFSYDTDGVYVDIGAKAAAFLPANEVSVQRVLDPTEFVPLNEEREFLIIREQNADGQITLSLRQLEVQKVWDRLTEVQEDGTSLQVRVTGVNKGGVTVDALGIRGFIPRSHLVEREDLESLVGQTLSASVLDMNREANKLVLSNRLAARSASMSLLEIGQLVDGKVASIKPFGVFVDLEGGATGLLHINQISKNYVESLNTLFQVGQPVKAIIADIDSGKNRISLSTKVLENFPGEMLEKMADVMAEAESRHGRARQAIVGE